MEDTNVAADRACSQWSFSGAPRRARPAGLRRGRFARHRMRATSRGVAR